jgi:hypothetical protein
LWRAASQPQEANLNESIGALKANKMKWQEILREAISEPNSRTAENARWRRSSATA